MVSGEQCTHKKLAQWLSTLGKVAMMRSRLTGGPKGVREDLIVPESPVEPIRGKRVRELCQSLETHPQVYA